MTEQTYQKLLENGLAAVATHSGVVLDATFSSRRKRERLRNQCTKAGIHLQVIELAADGEEIQKRLKARGETVAEVSDARLEDLKKLSAGYEAPSEVADLIRVSTADGVLDTVRALLLCLAEKQSAPVNRSTT